MLGASEYRWLLSDSIRFTAVGVSFGSDLTVLVMGALQTALVAVAMNIMAKAGAGFRDNTSILLTVCC